MATLYERSVFYCVESLTSPLTLAQKADLGKIILHEFYLSGYNKNQISLYQSIEPEGTFTVINYPDSFTEKIDQIIADFCTKKESQPEKPKVTKSDTDTKRKRIPVKPGTIKAWSAKPQNPESF